MLYRGLLYRDMLIYRYIVAALNLSHVFQDSACAYACA